jgi:ABC-2 type transport system permease protein
MIVDTINPNLKWDNPQKAMKGNLNGLFAMLIVFGYCALLSFIGATILKNLSPNLLTIISLILNISISIFLYKLLLNKTQKLLSKD